jgi:hypothetical protein
VRLWRKAEPVLVATYNDLLGAWRSLLLSLPKETE